MMESAQRLPVRTQVELVDCNLKSMDRDIRRFFVFQEAIILSRISADILLHQGSLRQNHEFEEFRRID